MTSLDIVQPVVDLGEKVLLPLDFSMTKDEKAREKAHRAMTEQIVSCLERGQDVAMVNLGDVSLYSSAGYLLDPIRRAGYSVRCIPGIASYSAAAAALGQTLAEGNSPLHIIPALDESWREALNLPGTKVFLKPGHQLPAVFDALDRDGRLHHASLVVNCGMEGEEIVSPFTHLPDKESYFTLIIIKEQTHGNLSRSGSR